MIKVGLIGCGNISGTYFTNQSYFNNFEITCCADINENVGKECADKYSIEYLSIEDLLANNQINTVLNLTSPKSHYEVIKKTLLAGKHSYCEKPFSCSFKEGQELTYLAKEKKLYIGNAPDTFLGAGAQLSRQLIEDGEIGEVRLGNAIFATPGSENWHPNPDHFYDKFGGPIFDMGPYYYTTLVNLLGPAKCVKAHSTSVSEYRIIGSGSRQGEKIKVATPTSIMASIEFVSKAIIQVFFSFDVINHKRNHIELYGTKGSLIVPDPNMFGGTVLTSFTEGGMWNEHPTENMRLGKINVINHSGRSNESPSNANYRGVGLSEMIDSIENNKQNRCSGELVLHVLDIMDSTIRSAAVNASINILTTCKKPETFQESQIAKLML